ncbi:dihydroxyacetone kinase subunit DhaK [Methylobacterium radiotolerans]|uniref:Glycerone kinase n=1 Tax=Methylobacterium radiotolerans (strain ATCC 27329 / DSM 1819 / JCM 2831 / NBRC 15690 / NCIMB 10815 / 0-1) TaxID=426355 RepID=B1M3Z6_METRJ|nr:dihydroxyacetone kinase subunit DhaK [Methylobacterium radiotolerans]ACB24873.1 Glycerone kinase [Methylobacterium radiotolerans JCM 2831]KTS05350.1 dihydroxyacetone kinase [Methylobacterium radiotolerans]KTS49034.1 dihydroxyacetone kinase [Methylobacterium radiotolerans]GEM96850.1 dihydroxyacetone kinase [Methylobacterium radiotolerans]
MAHFIDARSTLVNDAVDGLVAASGGRLARLDGDPGIRVVLRAAPDSGKVAVVSGGGSGHEPAHAGFVGPGLLSAAVCGDVFASPSVDAVLAGILAVTGPAGCLLVIKNYAGDRLNFGLAAERARALGHKVETVIVSDDIALPDAKQPRGVAGTLFVHKVAGHAAEAGEPLETVAALARRAAGAAKSLGIAVSTCTIPGSARSERLAEGQAELGLGIHGEPGAERIALPKASELARMMAERLARSVPGADGLALLVNNLGSASALEMQILTRAVLATDLGRRVRLLLGPAPLMTALDMHGASLSVLPLDDALERALSEPVPVPAWPAAVRVEPPILRPVPEGLAGEAFAPSHDAVTAARIRAVAEALIRAEGSLNSLDAKVGDGDAGTTFAGAARAVQADLDRLPQTEPAALCRALAERIGRAVGGSSGVLGSIFFAATASALADGAAWPEALGQGVARVQGYGGAKAGDRTLLDALIPAVEALKNGDLAAAAAAARAGAEATAGMERAGAGRSSYLAAGDLAGVQDPGAAGVAAAFAALAGA